ncbi:hypothetical protein M430DRAFT_182910 [Amorphotheca resinae ATCC 22711]|jgi:hypothetical protein|uniref:Uncharacterized protein n=1 Tax=Amorphotheca resinae ATCC 22711 TaxID=857342 RepID=A0A2T3ARU6_AMORE|nr:hypothetical protein M430DRAFT_182910 [Amorphotheca resinae ATCC 22711]PSS09099.1 hypothetical protein M430DRAFT_182910 [Amorphotheca resinae ATCC 22711]
MYTVLVRFRGLFLICIAKIRYDYLARTTVPSRAFTGQRRHSRHPRIRERLLLSLLALLDWSRRTAWLTPGWSGTTSFLTGISTPPNPLSHVTPRRLCLSTLGLLRPGQVCSGLLTYLTRNRQLLTRSPKKYYYEAPVAVSRVSLRRLLA